MHRRSARSRRLQSAVVHGECEAQIEIPGGRIIAGHLPMRAKKLVREWLVSHEGDVAAAWERAANRINPGKIEPLP